MIFTRLRNNVLGIFGQIVLSGIVVWTIISILFEYLQDLIKNQKPQE